MLLIKSIITQKLWTLLVGLFFVLVFIALIVIIPQYQILKLILLAGNVSVLDKLSFFGQSMINAFVLLSLAELVLYILILILLFINSTLLAYYFSIQVLAKRSVGMSAIGIIVFLFGLGCASCGSVFLTSIFGITASYTIISFLPWHGLEFLILAIIILAFSTYWIAKKIENPPTCRI